MKFEQNKPYKRIAAKGIVVHLQDGHVFHGDVYVGPEPKGSGSMSLHQLVDAAKAAKKPEPKKEAKKKKKEEPKKKAVLHLGTKKRKAVKRVVGKR